ncbi:MAG: enoyl-CoA hydratase-related protein [Desulfobacterium sp.]|jgi:enoyl-CoA hydratase/carnithine racemase|nr:enoyl-CoA hydratase-related protein [Desulfobacterium sp.]
MTDKQPVLMEKENGVGTITLNRPEQKNTFTQEFAALLNRYLKDLDEDDGVRVVVIKAAGKHFSTGIDLAEFKDKSPGELRAMIAKMDQHNKTIAQMKKPVIASVKGYAIANGAGLVFATDLAIASESAKFGTTAINVGLICLGPGVPLSRLVPRKKLLEMVLGGDIIDAKEAERLGMINRVVPDDQLDSATMEFAEKLAKKSPLAVECGKRGIYGMSDLPYHQALDYMGEMFTQLCATNDAKEGLAAFQEKREPRWTKT